MCVYINKLGRMYIAIRQVDIHTLIMLFCINIHINICQKCIIKCVYIVRANILNVFCLPSSVPNSWYASSHLIFVVTPWAVIIPISQIRKLRLRHIIQFAQVYPLIGGAIRVQIQRVWLPSFYSLPLYVCKCLLFNQMPTLFEKFRLWIKEKRMKRMKIVARIAKLYCH